MPVSNFLLSLALVLHPVAGDHSGALSFGPDSIVQPHGGAAPPSIPSMDASSKDPAMQSVKGQKGSHSKPASGKGKTQAQWIQKGQHTKGADVKGKPAGVK